jgi:hypothetical protein
MRDEGRDSIILTQTAIGEIDQLVSLFHTASKDSLAGHHTELQLSTEYKAVWFPEFF